MNNEEIRENIAKFQQKIEASLAANPYTFELNPEILKYKKEIDKLRAKCSHLNASNKVQTFNGRCIYCGTKLNKGDISECNQEERKES